MKGGGTADGRLLWVPRLHEAELGYASEEGVLGLRGMDLIPYRAPLIATSALKHRSKDGA